MLTALRPQEVAAGRGQAALQTIWRRAFIHEEYGLPSAQPAFVRLTPPNSWSALRSATTLSDEQISNCLRETALYFLLAHIGNDGASRELSTSRLR